MSKQSCWVDHCRHPYQCGLLCHSVQVDVVRRGFTGCWQTAAPQCRSGASLGTEQHASGPATQTLLLWAAPEFLLCDFLWHRYLKFVMYSSPFSPVNRIHLLSLFQGVVEVIFRGSWVVLRKLIRKPSAKLRSKLCPHLAPPCTQDWLHPVVCLWSRGHNAGRPGLQLREVFLSFLHYCWLHSGCQRHETGPLPSRKSGSTWKDPRALIYCGRCLAEWGHGQDGHSLRAGLCSSGVCSHCRQQGAWMPRGAAPLLQGNPSYVIPLGITSVSGDISLL